MKQKRTVLGCTLQQYIYIGTFMCSVRCSENQQRNIRRSLFMSEDKSGEEFDMKDKLIYANATILDLTSILYPSLESEYIRKKMGPKIDP